MADALHSADNSAADYPLCLSQLAQTNSDSPNFLEEKQQSSIVPHNSIGDAFENPDKCVKLNAVVSGQEDTFYTITEEADVCGVVRDTEEITEKHEVEVQAKCSTKCSVKILQAIDDTEEVDPKNDNDRSKGDRKEKKPRWRRGRVGIRTDALWNCCDAAGKEKKGLTYSRKEMVALRFEGIEEQMRKWVEVYCGLDPLVAQEYDGLVKKYDVDIHHLEHVVDFDPRPRFCKAAGSGENCSQVVENQFENPTSTSFPTSCLPLSEETSCLVPEEEFNEDDDSDEDYSSIQKPACMVTGEPDFDSGPPLDGLEYLRRVRWEAAKIPKVKVSKVVKVKEQRPYMPQIPNIMECPNHLLPLKEWEDNFLAVFSELRLLIVRLMLTLVQPFGLYCESVQVCVLPKQNWTMKFLC